MKPFNKEEALAGKPVVTRGGEPVTELKFFNGGDYKLAGVVKGSLETWAESGKFVDGASVSNWDLFMATTKRTGYVAIHGKALPSGGSALAYSTHVYPSIEEAKSALRGVANMTPMAVVPVEWEE